MDEPVTTGAFVAGVLAAGASALAKGALGAAGKDAYKALKALVTRIAGPNVEQIEAKPDSDARAEVLAELVEEQIQVSAIDGVALQNAAEQLRQALLSDGHSALVDKRVTVIATHGGMAAGRDQYFGALPARDKSKG